jgi:hypothetical protein
MSKIGVCAAYARHARETYGSLAPAAHFANFERATTATFCAHVMAVMQSRADQEANNRAGF